MQGQGRREQEGREGMVRCTWTWMQRRLSDCCACSTHHPHARPCAPLSHPPPPPPTSMPAPAPLSPCTHARSTCLQAQDVLQQAHLVRKRDHKLLQWKREVQGRYVSVCGKFRQKSPKSTNKYAWIKSTGIIIPHKRCSWVSKLLSSRIS